MNINVATKEKDTSIPKNITHAFKCDESEMWIKSTFREVDAMIENNVYGQSLIQFPRMRK